MRMTMEEPDRFLVHGKRRISSSARPTRSYCRLVGIGNRLEPAYDESALAELISNRLYRMIDMPQSTNSGCAHFDCAGR
jgi:hypothetical protein